jgi:hypothetical protein
MPPMRAALMFLVAVVSACGSVSADRPDAPPGPIDAAIDAAVDAPAVDGALPQPGDLVWVRSMSAAFGLGVADGAGGLVFTGSITAPTDFGGGSMTPAGETDLAIGGFKPDDASYVYQTRINKTGGGSVFGFLEMTDSIGNPLVYGVSYGDVDLGKGPVTAGGTDKALADGYIGRYGPNAPAWVNRLVGPGEDKIIATAPAPGGEVYGAGWFEQTTTWNGVQLTSAGGRDLFISRMNTYTGAVSKTAMVGGTGRDEISNIAGDGTNLIVGGFFDDALAFGGTASSISATAGSSLDAYVAKLDANLAGIWAVKFGGTGDDRSTVVALDAAGDVYTAGAFQDQVAFGAVNLTAMGMHDLCVAKLRGTNGSVVWAIQLGTTGDDSPSRILVDKAGHPVVVASLNGDALIASFDASNGAMRWQKQVATAGSDSVFNASIGATGDVYAVVNLGGPFDFGKPLIGPPAPASVVMRIVP